MNVCLGKHTYVETMGMYVCLGKHTYLETRGMYVCMYVKGMYVWGNIHTYLETRGMYVCQRYVNLEKRTYLQNDSYVCMSGDPYIHA